MPTFRYSAYDARGKTIRAVGSADSLRQLRQQLSHQRIFLIEGTPEKEVQEKKSRWHRGLTLSDSAILLRQLAILVNSGMTLEVALKLTADQAEQALHRSALECWRDGLSQGYGFAVSIKQSPYTLSERVMAAIEVSEETGHLHEVLERLADDLEQGSDNLQTLQKGLIYPAVMIVVAITVIAVLMGYVVPQVAKVFVNSHQELPLLTQVTIAISHFFRVWGVYVLLAMGGAAALFFWQLRDPRQRLKWHRCQLRLPFVGGWVRLSVLADWCQSLGSMLNSGVTIMPALSIASASVTNLCMQQEFEAITESVRQGNSLYASLKSSGVAPGFLLHMVSSGEASGELSQMLLKVARYYSNRLKHTMDTLLKLMEPALVVFMGGIVMLIIGAVLVPIVKMNQMI